MIVKHIISVILVDSYTVSNNDNTKIIGKLRIYKHGCQIMFGDSRIN